MASRGDDGGGYARPPAAARGGGLGGTRRGWGTTRCTGNAGGASHERGHEGGRCHHTRPPHGVRRARRSRGLRLAQASNCPTPSPRWARCPLIGGRGRCVIRSHPEATPRPPPKALLWGGSRTPTFQPPVGCVQRTNNLSGLRAHAEGRGDRARYKMFMQAQCTQTTSFKVGDGEIPCIQAIKAWVVSARGRGRASPTSISQRSATATDGPEAAGGVVDADRRPRANGN